jgi:hypothetical protein
MKRRLHLSAWMLASALALPAVGLRAQCTNTVQYPGLATTPDALGAVTTISSCSYQQEYSVVTSIQDGGTYQFTCTGGSYITVHQGTADGAVLGNGYSPLTVTASGTGDLFAHWNVNDQCGTATGCQTTTVQLFLDCVPPAAQATVLDDCDNNQFSISVDITGIGDATDVDLVWSVDGGPDQTDPDLQVGTYLIGPFTVGEAVNVTVAHSTDPLCNLHINGLVSGVCPVIIDCSGPAMEYSFCYHNYQDSVMTYQGNGSFPISLIFNAGQMESCCDNVTIYNGPNASGDILYQGNNSGQSMAGVMVISNNPFNALTMVFHSDVSVSCANNGYPPLDWTVGCLDCTAPEATFTVNTDCDNFSFMVDVDLTVLGSDPDLEITNDGGVPPVTVTAPGLYSVGPFTANIPVTVSLVNSDNALCSISSDPLVNPLCPQVITCGGAPVDDQYCYNNSDNHTWSWSSSGNEPLIIIFSAGSIESNTWDHIRIYNGPDNTSPLLYENGPGTTDLTGMQYIASSGSIYMEMSSDASVSCASGSMIQWVWQVGCLDCEMPEATYVVNTDCSTMTYSVTLDITDLGTDDVIDITNDGGALPVPAPATGTYTVGPFTAGVPVNITMENDQNSLCNVTLGPIVNPLCPTILACGTDTVQETYCFPENDHHAWHWQSDGGQPLYMLFSAGTIMALEYSDTLTVYDGPDENSPILYQNPGGFLDADLTGLLLISTGPEIYMTLNSGTFFSCTFGWSTAWAWEVACLDCTNPAATFEVVPDCLHHTYQVAVNVSSTGSDPFVRLANSALGDTLLNVGAGITLTDPIPMDNATVITVLNETNDLCRIFSTELNSPATDCWIPSCEIQGYEYCYTNLDTAYYTYVGTSDTEPLTIQFTSGELLANDHVQIFDGPNQNAPMIYNGNNGGIMAPLAFNSTNPENIITLRIASDALYSCADGYTDGTFRWDVLCGWAGVQERQPTSFTMYPNPTTGQVTLVLPATVKGAVDVRVLDIAGRTVHQERFTVGGHGPARIDLQQLQSGNYTVLLTTEDNTGAEPLQIVR